jgi:hypothetical protein
MSQLPDGYHLCAGHDKCGVEPQAEAIRQAEIALLRRLKENIPDNDTDCAEDHVDGGTCEPENHWRRDGRFFYGMEVTDLLEAELTKRE